ncbi:MAG: hypothetical protein B7Y56_15780 [Gallionellales bacterium 35-53-114]|jgi:hypothetical protein|nr:MAG: hypothetical protein B7Y56_15780 [Gallionellales bacterium 35-53-114]OYZ62112.1 MAG: hypothetical protein B7Y04_15315 [Gallionellales bacterium 24-53-125]HQS59824.1 Imm50 family immunity protein [Gallionellaceae bacterium]HQS76578.1 Imm50 family immunity protein [Gallionellaceae bacterium]
MVENAEKVLSYFGYWPDFCDAKIESFSYNKAGTIELCIFYIDSNLAKSADVNLRFNGVSEVALDNLFSENVIDEISFEGSGPFTVTIDGCYGLEGSFKSKSIEVVNFTAKDHIAEVRC